MAIGRIVDAVQPVRQEVDITKTPWPADASFEHPAMPTIAERMSLVDDNRADGFAHIADQPFVELLSALGLGAVVAFLTTRR
ncbi:MAG: hypothetical protein ACRYF2_16185 [Janthinobacterium lividum]